MATKDKPLPKTLGDAADLLFERQQARLSLQRKQEEELNKLKLLEDQAEEHVLALLSAQGLESCRGKVATVTVQHKSVPKVLDWDKVRKWVAKTADIAIFQKRLSSTHFIELQEAKVVVPGVEYIAVKQLSITKAAR